MNETAWDNPPMKSCIATVSLPGKFAEKLAAAQAAKFDAIEIFEQDFVASDHAPRDVGRTSVGPPPTVAACR